MILLLSVVVQGWVLLTFCEATFLRITPVRIWPCLTIPRRTFPTRRVRTSVSPLAVVDRAHMWKMPFQRFVSLRRLVMLPFAQLTEQLYYSKGIIEQGLASLLGTRVKFLLGCPDSSTSPNTRWPIRRSSSAVRGSRNQTSCPTVTER